MSSPTSPLRPERIRHSELARRLEARKRTICDTWVTRVTSNPPVVSGQRLEPLDTGALRAFYDDLCTALNFGQFAVFDEQLVALSRMAHGSGYRLSDVLSILIALGDRAEEVIAVDFSARQALAFRQALNGTLDYALTQVARFFTAEIESTLALERERAQARLAELDRAKSRFISIAAHELKTPLTLIQGYSDILINDLVESSNERAMHIARGLAAGARRLQQIINDMIAVSMIDNAMLALHVQVTSLSHVIRIAVNDIRTQMEERRVDIRVDPSIGQVRPISIDPQRMYDALSHIISNSVKYTPDGGHVTIAARTLNVGQGEESVVEITIADEGIGIAPEYRERIFDTFFGSTDVKLHSSSRIKFKGGGPGLGLAVAKGIIEAHGGKIWAESPGYDEVTRPGTTIHILLPARTSPPETSERLRLDLDSA